MTEPIGGEAVTPGTLRPPLRLEPGSVLTASGRAALRWLLLALGARSVLLPAYACPALEIAVRRQGCVPSFYHVDDHLMPIWTEIDPSADVLVLVHPFGWLLPRRPVLALRRAAPHLTIIEDISHTLANRPDHRQLGPTVTDGAYASLRKCLPVPSGGTAILWGSPLPPPPPAGPDAPPSVRARIAAPRDDAPRLAAELAAAEDILDRDTALVGIDRVTLGLLDSLPLHGDAWRRRTRANWRILRDGLRGQRSLHWTLSEGVCPLGYVLRHENRTALARRLLRQGILAGHHWPLAGEARRQASRSERLLTGTVLTLPCDGRYGPTEMRRIVEVVRQQP